MHFLNLTFACKQFPNINISLINEILQASDENVNVLYHPPDLEGPILFSFREKVFFGKKRASVRVESGEWSDRFALDAAGSTGVVECKSNEMIYEVIFITISNGANKNQFNCSDCRSQYVDPQFVD